MKLSRRRFSILLLAVAPLLLFASVAAPQKPTPNKPYLVFVGTYTNKTTSKGIYAYRFDPGTGKLTSHGVAAESEDPSFLAVRPSGKYLYAVNEIDHFGAQKSGAVSAFSIDHKTGKLALLNQAATQGAGPCHISLDKSGKFIFVANYDGGSVAVFPVLEDGSVGPASAFVQHSGSSVNKERQEGPHAHWIATSPDNRFALAADLAYVLTEMENSVTSFAYNASKGSLSPLQTLSTLSSLRKDYSGPKEAAEIAVHPNGKFLYASNRGGVDTISAFGINPGKGTLKLIDEFPTMGKTPRNFAIDPTGKFLLAANQESNNIVTFRIDPATGRLSPTGDIVEAPAPVCITFVAPQ